MKTKEKKGPKEEWFYLTKEDLSGMDVPTLEKSLEALNNAYDRKFEVAKNFDNKASLLLVIYVGIFTIFACFIREWIFQSVALEVIFCIGFALTVLSYISSIVFLVFTIMNRKYLDSTPKMICKKGITDYEKWLRRQIIDRSRQIYGNLKNAEPKATFYSIGCICLAVSVVLTLALASFLVFCSVGICA